MGSGLAALMGILGGTGEGLSKNVEDQQKAADLAERQRADRRLPSKVDALLRAIGWAIVPLDVPKNDRDSAL